MFGGDFGLPPGPRYGRRSTGRMRAHRHGRVELVVDLGLDSFHLSIVGQPLGARAGGRHLVRWHHLFLEG
eukprot:scaffold42494_cov57-Phaeocystis_antarctica.AAC.1